MSETLKLLKTLWDMPISKRANWSQERRQQQALRCRQIQPWTKSTGPRTKLGKVQSSKNGRSNRNGSGINYYAIAFCAEPIKASRTVFCHC